jgi:imidazolonepropionase-like amidohydrolase
MKAPWGLCGLGLAVALVAVPPGALAALRSAAASAAASETVAVKAGKVYVVEGGAVLTKDATVLIRDGKISAVGEGLPIPPGVRVVDYGPDAVIAPGLVSADSLYGWPTGPSARTADAGVRAVDQIDPYTPLWSALVEGVTSVYIAPARARLIAGQGAVVKSAGNARILAASAVIHGSISAEARSTPGYWNPPVPATVDQGMGVAEPQLPRTTMGALVALDEVLALARGTSTTKDYGPNLAQDLKPLLDEKRTWRMGANTASEIRALVDYFGTQGLPLIVDGGGEAGEVVDLLARAHFPVIIGVPLTGNSGGRDFGKDEDAAWPLYDTASKLHAAAVPFAIAPGSAASAPDLRLAGALAMRGGLSEDVVLGAITLDAAKILGVGERVGSLAPGKDADLAVFNGPPLQIGTSVLATWIDGEVAWKKNETSSVVVSVGELHVGDGQVLAPGEILMRDGKIVEVGSRVSHPHGATIVRGEAAMPGMIDALGFLGLEGSRKDFSPRMKLARIVEPGDATDRRVARAGVTTVVLGSRGSIGDGSPTIAYKPAGDDVETMVIADPNALRMQWSERIRVSSGEKVKETLAKAAEYKKKWEEYETAIKTWVPKPPKEEKAEKKEEEKKEPEAGAEKKEGEKKEEGKEEPKEKTENGKEEPKKEKDSKEKKKDAEPPALTGVWETSEAVVTGTGSAILRLRMLEKEGSIEGSLRCAALTDGLVDLCGKLEDKKVELHAQGTRGAIDIELSREKEKLEGKVKAGGSELAVSLTQTVAEYAVAKRTDRRREKPAEEPKDKPKPPGINLELEPLRQAMLGKGAVIVAVDRDDEILDCVEAFTTFGIKPVLFGAEKADEIASQLKGRVSGVIPSTRVIETGGKLGTRERNSYAELQGVGIPVAFHSEAEEGAADLPILAAWAMAHGLSPDGALRALTSDAAKMLAIDSRVGRLAEGLDADVLLLDGSPLDVSTSVVRVWVSGKEIR